MPYASKRRAENETNLRKEASKCKKITSFFCKNTGDRHDIANVDQPQREEESSFNIPDSSPDDLDPDIVIEKNINRSEAPSTVRPANVLDLADEKSQNDLEECKKSDHKSKISQSETSQKSSLSGQVYLYRGYPLNISSIVTKAGPKVLSLYKEKRKYMNEERTRTFVKCLVCAEFEEEARRFATNGQVYMVHGVRCDGQKKLQDIVDHLHGAPHTAALKMKTVSTQWTEKDSTHPWLRTLKRYDSNIIQTLIQMAVDVYNDSKLLTPTAWSWPSRSLAQFHAEEQFKSYSNTAEGGLGFSQFHPQAIHLHYRDPNHYAEMLRIEGDLEREKLKGEYDPRPAVQKFMLAKDRRMNLPTVSTYMERDFIKKFFAQPLQQ